MPSRASVDSWFEPLVRGDRVRLVSPASTPDVASVKNAVDVLSSWGLTPEVASHALDQRGLYAGRDEDRLSDLNDALRDPGVRAIITTRGGAGAYRIAGLDFGAAARDRKPLVGFSDISFLHLALWTRARAPGIHGCLDGQRASATLRQLLMKRDGVAIDREGEGVSAPVHSPGRATGLLVGGGLTAVATSVGVRLPNLDGLILFLEDQRTIGLGPLDRWLTQLRRSGALDGIAGIVLGSFEGFRDYEDRGVTVTDILRDHLCGLGVPVLGGLYAGHALSDAEGRPDQCCLPLGALVHLDADGGTVTVLPTLTASDRPLFPSSLVSTGTSSDRGRLRLQQAPGADGGLEGLVAYPVGYQLAA